MILINANALIKEIESGADKYYDKNEIISYIRNAEQYNFQLRLEDIFEITSLSNEIKIVVNEEKDVAFTPTIAQLNMIKDLVLTGIGTENSPLILNVDAPVKQVTNENKNQ